MAEYKYYVGNMGTNSTLEAIEDMYNLYAQTSTVKLPIGSKFGIRKVIFNNPVTIVYWSDGGKTVVKAQNEPFDEEKGLAMAISKKAFGNKGAYFNEFKKMVKSMKGEKL